MPQLSTEQKTRIVDRYECNMTQAEIVSDLGIPLSTVNSVLKRYRERGAVERKKGSGRLQAVTDQTRRLLKRIVVKERNPTRKSIQAQLPCKVSTWLISHELRKMKTRKNV